MKKVSVALIGAGERGMNCYAPYALRNPQEIEFVAVADADPEKVEKFKTTYNLSEDMCFGSWEEMLERPKLADAVIICTSDRLHYIPTIKALERGYHVLLEKPMSPDPLECIKLDEGARMYKRLLSVCHVLRYTDFYSTVKKLLDEGKIGDLVSIHHIENVGYWHQAHSFVRGNWRNSKESSPMILAKCCHDTDILLWLANADCERIASFGSLMHFKKENAPKGAPERCLDGCPAEKSCPYYAPDLYLTENTDWPTSAISLDRSLEARIKALKEGPYGRCVYHCDNDVVDHQVVSMEFSNGVTATFTMCAFSHDVFRETKLMGTMGEICGSPEKNVIEVYDFKSGKKEVINLSSSEFGHSGGDDGIMRDFVRLVRSDGREQGRTDSSISVQSHLIAFAAEKSRLEKRTVDLKEYAEDIKSQG